MSASSQQRGLASHGAGRRRMEVGLSAITLLSRQQPRGGDDDGQGAGGPCRRRSSGSGGSRGRRGVRGRGAAGRWCVEVAVLSPSPPVRLPGRPAWPPDRGTGVSGFLLAVLLSVPKETRLGEGTDARTHRGGPHSPLLPATAPRRRPRVSGMIVQPRWPARKTGVAP